MLKYIFLILFFCFPKVTYAQLFKVVKQQCLKNKKMVSIEDGEIYSFEFKSSQLTISRSFEVNSKNNQLCLAQLQLKSKDDLQLVSQKNIKFLYEKYSCSKFCAQYCDKQNLEKNIKKSRYYNMIVSSGLKQRLLLSRSIYSKNHFCDKGDSELTYLEEVKLPKKSKPE